MKRKVIGFAVLFVGLAFVTGSLGAQDISWEIKQHSTDIDSLKGEVSAMMRQGFIPMDITANEDGVYVTLLIKLERSTIKKWTIERYEVGEHGEAINSHIRQGYLPWGIMFRGSVIDILYVGM